MKINQENSFDDDKMKTFLEESKLSASENLQHRIMQQIMTEKALKPQNVKSSKSSLRIAAFTAAAIYSIGGIVGAYMYLTGGIPALMSKEFLIPVLTLTSIVSVCGLVNILDEKRYQK